MNKKDWAVLLVWLALSPCAFAEDAPRDDSLWQPYNLNQGLSSRLDALSEWQISYDLSLRRNDRAAVLDWRFSDYGIKATAGIASDNYSLTGEDAKTKPYIGMSWKSDATNSSNWVFSVDLGTTLDIDQPDNAKDRVDEDFGQLEVNILTNTQLSFGLNYQF